MLQVGNEWVVRNHRFVASLGDHCQVVQIFEELLVVVDWKNDGSALAAVVSEVLKCLAHGERLRRRFRMSRARSAA